MDILLIMMLLAVGAMFLLSSRTRKQQRQAVEFRSTLDVGDQVMTGSGLFGTVVAVDGDVITLESPSGGRTDWLRAAISKLATPPYAEGEDEEQEGEGEYEDEAEYEEYDGDDEGAEYEDTEYEDSEDADTEGRVLEDSDAQTAADSPGSAVPRDAGEDPRRP